MTQLIEYARAYKLQQIYGHILAHNTTMRAMCEQLGFLTAIDADDPALVRATLVLSDARATGATAVGAVPMSA